MLPGTSSLPPARQQQGPAANEDHGSISAPIRKRARDSLIRLQELEYGRVHVDVHPGCVHGAVLKGADELEPGSVPDVGEARIGVGFKRPLVGAASQVRSNTAPQRSSLSTRSGDSLEWISAMHQSLISLPPFIVSAKCTSQVSW
jgi:hypothetical protein